MNTASHRLRVGLEQELAKIEPTVIGDWAGCYARLTDTLAGAVRVPCQVLLTDGRILDRVYMVDCGRIASVLRELDAPRVIPACEIRQLWPSIKRLNPTLVREMARFGERGMGCPPIFELETRQGTRFDWSPMFGNSPDEICNIDFPDLPSPFSPTDVVAVHSGGIGSPRIEHRAAYLCQFFGTKSSGSLNLQPGRD
ncbi:MAG: hypothetical protein WD768_05755 [Phycisphaeraceae bacterium]